MRVCELGQLPVLIKAHYLPQAYRLLGPRRDQVSSYVDEILRNCAPRQGWILTGGLGEERSKRSVLQVGRAMLPRELVTAVAAQHHS